MKHGDYISIIIPVYNIRQYIVQCLESVVNQTYSNLEIILVDDGSTDGSGNICDQYAVGDRRIKVIHKSNEGLVRARKTGLGESTGRFIAYVDGDDWIEPDMMEKLHTALVREQVSIAMCGRYEDTGNVSRAVCHGIGGGRYDKKGLLENVYPRMIVNGAFFEWGIFPGVWDKLFRRECLEPFQMAVDDALVMGEDAACTYPALLNADSIYVLHECLYHYRQNAASIVHQGMDCGSERQRFRILHDTVRDSLEKYKDIYDLTGQWKEYLLFLMTPRADVLYKDMEKLDYLFPFPGVKRGSRIVLYGMGTYGQRLYKYLEKTHFCKVVACADRNYAELSKQGLPAVSPEKIAQYDYDSIVVASSFAGSRAGIYHILERLAPPEKVHLMDVSLIKSRESLKAFGLASDT